jgi:hypothetical protein
MGLDTVEIVMRIEEEFSIDLPDAELGSVITVGDLYNIVLSKLDTTTTAECLSSKAFYRTRRALVDCLGVSRRSIRPATSLETLFPKQSRHRRWADVAKSIELKFPTLRASRAQRNLFGALMIALPPGIVFTTLGVTHAYVGLPVDSSGLWVSALVIWLVLLGIIGPILMGLEQRRALELPVGTAGDLARMLLTMNLDEFAPRLEENHPVSRESVWARIVHIFSDQMQIEVEKILPEAKISEDLRID